MAVGIVRDAEVLVSNRPFVRQFERAREDAGLSRADAAERAGITLPGLYRAIRDDHNPTLATMEKLAAAVGKVLVIKLVDGITDD